jgi:hypothetical protein
MPFSCSICGEESTRICVRCTKDACDNHLCEKCHKCSDCCECEVALAPHPPESVREALHPALPAEAVVEAVAVVPEASVPEAVVEAPAEAEAPVESTPVEAPAGQETPIEPAASAAAESLDS